MNKHRTKLQAESDKIDCDLAGIQNRIESLADQIKIAGPKLRLIANTVSTARSGIRSFMHKDDRFAAPY